MPSERVRAISVVAGNRGGWIRIDMRGALKAGAKDWRKQVATGDGRAAAASQSLGARSVLVCMELNCAMSSECTLRVWFRVCKRILIKNYLTSLISHMERSFQLYEVSCVRWHCADTEPRANRQRQRAISDGYIPANTHTRMPSCPHTMRPVVCSLMRARKSAHKTLSIRSDAEHRFEFTCVGRSGCQSASVCLPKCNQL